MKKSCLLIAMALSALALGSCNTFIGMGRDIQSLGSGMVNKGHGKAWDGSEPKAKTAPQTAPPTAPVTPQ